MKQLQRTIAQLPPFNWTNLPLEFFRGPGLSFPVSTELLVAPSFNTLVMGALNSFHEEFTGNQLLDPEYDGFTSRIVDQVTDQDGDVLYLGPRTIILHMTYMCKREKYVPLTLGRPEDLVIWH